MREQFEKLPDVAEKLNEKHIVFIANKYTTANSSFYDSVNWLNNGAWYAYQEQQKEIDGFQDEIKALILQWRSNADYANKISSEDFIENTLNECADELERILQVMHDQHLSC